MRCVRRGGARRGGLVGEFVEVRVADLRAHLGQAILLAQEVEELRWLHRRERCVSTSTIPEDSSGPSRKFQDRKERGWRSSSSAPPWSGWSHQSQCCRDSGASRVAGTQGGGWRAARRASGSTSAHAELGRREDPTSRTVPPEPQVVIGAPVAAPVLGVMSSKCVRDR